MQQQRKINAEWCWKCARNTYHHHQEQLQQVQQNVVCVMDLTKLRHACMKFTKFTGVTYSTVPAESTGTYVGPVIIQRIVILN